MGLRDLELKKSYDSDEDDILNDFYIPALSESIEYDRLVGFFSSSSLALAARGITKFILNGGKIRLIAGARLKKADVEIIKEGYESPEKILEDSILKDLSNIKEEFIKDHIRALGWMVASKTLDIRIAIVNDDNRVPLDYNSVYQLGIFHQKVGIMKDKVRDSISFSGSDNESASAWLQHIEEFKVFRSWDEKERNYLDADIKKFEKFWSGSSKRTQVLDLPSAVKNKLIDYAPDNFDDLNLERWYKKQNKSEKIRLFDHQKKAIESWLNNGMKGIFEMATGTGKTFAALGCLEKVIEKEEKLVVVIAAPYTHLARQWSNEIEKFGIDIETIVADSSNPSWKNEFSNCLLDIKIGTFNKLAVITTHATFSSEDFMNIISNCECNLFLIVDEVHGVGAPKRREGLKEFYQYRLGLSATPKRWFDFEGTEKIFTYFGDVVFGFSLDKAINTINPITNQTYLTPYEYKPYFVELSSEELEEYKKATKKIAKKYYEVKNDEEMEKWLNLLLIKRQQIIKNAQYKYKALESILDNMGFVKHCLIYCSPQQIEQVQNILNEKNIVQHKFTNEEGIKPSEKYNGLSERDYLIKLFTEGRYDALVAMKCLDEGVDIPPAKIAIILASTGNPRQYIQRRGRVLRHYPNKEKAIIYDILVIPNLLEISDDEYLSKLERKIIEKELKRYREFAYSSINVIESLAKIDKISEKYKISIRGGESI